LSTREMRSLYERHLLFDKVVESSSATARERFEAFALSVREVLAQRWVQTKTSYARANPKRVYYLSMEFLIGRSLANNVTNLLLDADARGALKELGLDWLTTLEQEPDAGLGNGGLGRLAACFLDSMATLELPPWAMACAMSTACSNRTSRTDGSWSSRIIGWRDTILGKCGGYAISRNSA